MLVSASPPAATCQPAPIVVQKPGMAPNSTYINDGEPPKRYSGPPAGYVKIVFGRTEIDNLCGRPPCDKVFLGCRRGDVLALPDPFSTSDAEFARITRHELAHFNGWPDTHGS
jgi:hypothetical protein